jgi:hypothetical protein
MQTMKTHPEIESDLPARLKRELKTIEIMIGIYCRAHHHPRGSICPDCSRLRTYATRRLCHCPFQENKPTCGNCRVHCYKPDMRETIKAVMRYAGPRMPLRHPCMTLRHLMDNRRNPLELREKNAPRKN